MSKLEFVLLPCPFCGSSKVEIVGTQCVWPGAGVEEIFSVECKECGAKSGVARDKTWAAHAWDKRTNISCGVFDEVEEHQNCTVQVLRNSVTGEVSVGWRRNDG